MAFVGAFILLVIAVVGMGFMVAMIAAAFRACQPAEHRHAGPKRSICGTCGYPGKGLEGKPCPECGGEFIEVSTVENWHRRTAINTAKGLGMALVGVGIAAALILMLRLSP